MIETLIKENMYIENSIKEDLINLVKNNENINLIPSLYELINIIDIMNEGDV